MDEFDIPIFKKSYDLYGEFYSCLKSFPKYEKYSLGQKCDLTLTEFVELLLLASELYKQEKVATLRRASVKLNLLRVFLRFCYELKILDKKKYLSLQIDIDEIGRMLGGWLKSAKEKSS